MREALFVKQNSEKWKSFENLDTTDPDVLAERFIEVTNDLAYAKTFYPKSSTTAYINGLASRFHQSIYKNKKEKSNRFITFWKTELPLIFNAYQKPLLYSFILFSTFALMGALSAKYDDKFVTLIMGESYVKMTNENIAKGDPFGVYKSMNEFAMFFQIAANNIYVSFIVFASGIFLSVGTVYHLIRNGIMLGAFQYYFFSKGLGWTSVLTIWIHGTLEISCIVIAGAAGLVIGNSILFPRTFTRLESFKRGAKDAMKMAVGISPILAVAAFLESFITRHTEMPVWLSISILVASFIFIVWYVVAYPILLNRKLKPDTINGAI